MAQVVEPESEKFALSPSADLEEIREFLRCESLERMQLCMRLQKQQDAFDPGARLLVGALLTGAVGRALRGFTACFPATEMPGCHGNRPDAGCPDRRAHRGR
eukprot:g17928.t1